MLAMQPSNSLFNFLAQPDMENIKLVAYPDGGGIPTIGLGHTAGVTLGMTCTMAQALAWAKQDMASAAAAVNRVILPQPTQNQFDMFTSLGFNIGVGAFMHEFGGVAQFNAGQVNQAADHFELWDKGGGKVVEGLLKRRKAEAIIFLGAPWQISRYAVDSNPNLSTATLTRCVAGYHE
jgi:lysozyme